MGQLMPQMVSMCANSTQHDLRLDLPRNRSLGGRVALQSFEQSGKAIKPSPPIHGLAPLEDLAKDLDRLALFIDQCEIHFHDGNHMWEAQPYPTARQAVVIEYEIRAGTELL